MPLKNIQPGHFVHVKLGGLLEAKPAPSSNPCQCGGCGRIVDPVCDVCQAPLEPHRPIMCEDAAARSASGPKGWIDAFGVAQVDHARIVEYHSKGRHVHTSCVRGLDDWLTDSWTRLA